MVIHTLHVDSLAHLRGKLPSIIYIFKTLKVWSHSSHFNPLINLLCLWWLCLLWYSRSSVLLWILQMGIFTVTVLRLYLFIFLLMKSFCMAYFGRFSHEWVLSKITLTPNQWFSWYLRNVRRKKKSSRTQTCRRDSLTGLCVTNSWTEPRPDGSSHQLCWQTGKGNCRRYLKTSSRLILSVCLCVLLTLMWWGTDISFMSLLSQLPLFILTFAQRLMWLSCLFFLNSPADFVTGFALLMVEYEYGLYWLLSLNYSLHITSLQQLVREFNQPIVKLHPFKCEALKVLATVYRPSVSAKCLCVIWCPGETE